MSTCTIINTGVKGVTLILASMDLVSHAPHKQYLRLLLRRLRPHVVRRYGNLSNLALRPYRHQDQSQCARSSYIPGDCEPIFHLKPSSCLGH